MHDLEGEEAILIAELEDLKKNSNVRKKNLEDLLSERKLEKNKNMEIIERITNKVSLIFFSFFLILIERKVKTFFYYYHYLFEDK